MLSSCLLLATSLSLLAAPGIEPGTQLVYRGTMTPVKDDGNPAVKEFELAVLATEANENAYALAWTLEETGRGGWTWLDRFDRWKVAADKRGEMPTGPALRYERAEGKSVVPLPPPVFASSTKIENDAAWTEGRLEYRVTDESVKADRVCWEIDVRSAYGHKRTLWIDKELPLVVAVNETVFIGQGDEHTLVFELTEMKTLPAEAAARTAAAFDDWLELRGSLAWQPRGLRDELSADQIQTLKTELPKVAQSAAIGPLAAIAKAAQQDTTGQKNRAGALAALRAAIVGRPVGELKLLDLAGQPLAADALQGKVIVLHFWEYRDTPLEEPYGQVGFLDFLWRQRPEAVVIGVHVDPRLADAETRGGAIVAARKLKAFMNLGYPVTYDDGSLLKRLGDPRIAGGKLPLFVVVGKDGKVAEYHAGLYDVKAHEGLVELDAVVKRALGKSE
ncbi:MAG: hypothetical protein WD872_07960 [Pirellulaceae bacterium]